MGQAGVNGEQDHSSSNDAGLVRRASEGRELTGAMRRRHAPGWTHRTYLITGVIAMLALPTADLIPVRALNQVTYCPRLYYLQYVDAVVPVNEHIEGGLFDHRR